MDVSDILADLSDDSDVETPVIETSELSHDVNTTHSSSVALSRAQTLLASVEPLVAQITSKDAPPSPKLVEKANVLSIEIDGTIETLNGQLQRLYSPRFPDLEKIVPKAEQYSIVTQLLGNNPERVMEKDLEQQLQEKLGKATAMLLVMSASDDPGQPLEQSALQEIESINTLINDLCSARSSIGLVVRDQLAHIAPNILEIVSIDVAVQLLAYTGGLAGLSTASPSNMHALGSPKTVSGVANYSKAPQGVLSKDPLISRVEPQYARQAIRLVAGKLVLAARVDAAASHKDGAQGRSWRAQIDARLEKLGAPPPNSLHKALPMPIEKSSKKRGGRRIRKLKEKYLPSELMKKNDRIAFGAAPSESGDVGGSMRTATSQSSNLKLSKSMQSRLS